MFFAKALVFASVALAMPSQLGADAPNPQHAALIAQSDAVITNVHNLQKTMAVISAKHPKAAAVVRANANVAKARLHLPCISRCTLPDPSVNNGLLGLGNLGGLLGGCLGGGGSGTLGNLVPTTGSCSLCDLLSNPNGLVQQLLNGLGLGGLLGGGGGSATSPVVVQPAPDADLVTATVDLLDNLLSLGTESQCGQTNLDQLIDYTAALVDSLKGLDHLAGPTSAGGCGCGTQPDVLSGVNALLKAH
ncbi:hypothetical protein HMN09_00863100 [Mycena chlorophos]|uniref:Uncharacterized protein n=1 Tax=Mycena chlorophos TaxID=658473 RepID=A0A8H6SVB8_MYCCL|nr:hypothetical protein HMN09_00863100 [Mycena chlorophos]